MRRYRGVMGLLPQARPAGLPVAQSPMVLPTVQVSPYQIYGLAARAPVAMAARRVVPVVARLSGLAVLLDKRATTQAPEVNARAEPTAAPTSAPVFTVPDNLSYDPRTAPQRMSAELSKTYAPDLRQEQVPATSSATATCPAGYTRLNPNTASSACVKTSGPAPGVMSYPCWDGRRYPIPELCPRQVVDEPEPFVVSYPPIYPPPRPGLPLGVVAAAGAVVLLLLLR